MNAPTTPPASPAVPGLLIVAHDQPELYREMQQLFADSPRILVLLDRRRADRRRHALAVPVERRRMERRSPLHIEDDLRQRNYILVRPHTRRPQDWRLTPDR